MSFRDTLVSRSAAVYTDFLVPHLTENTRLLDCGCGAGSITVGLAGLVQWLVGLDVSAADLKPAVSHLASKSIGNVRFVAGNGTELHFADGSFDMVLMHSVLETAVDTANLVLEASRVLVPGGLLAAASVEYGGLVLAGPHRQTLERFFAVRERLWSLDRIARSRAGRELRRLLHGCGFTDIDATAHYLSYGTTDAVRSFGEERAQDCEEPWFSSRSLMSGLFTEEELRTTQRAWQEWSLSPESFLAFAWCRVLGRKPGTCHT
jgi:SAM-dependent methyltransferase